MLLDWQVESIHLKFVRMKHHAGAQLSQFGKTGNGSTLRREGIIQALPAP